jgi:hypothetical protein
VPVLPVSFCLRQSNEAMITVLWPIGFLFSNGDFPFAVDLGPSCKRPVQDWSSSEVRHD